MYNNFQRTIINLLYFCASYGFKTERETCKKSSKRCCRHRVPCVPRCVRCRLSLDHAVCSDKHCQDAFSRL